MAGRPKMTEAQKAAAKADREAAKAGTGAAADRAEARSQNGKAPTTAAPAVSKRIDNPELDQEEKALFLNHMPKIKVAKEAVATATANLRNLYKKAKAEGGFEKADFDYAFELETAEKEAKARAKIARNLKIAKIVGSDLGAQLDMFLEPVRVPAADRAYEEGRAAAMKNEPARPKYDPSTEQSRKYLEGYHSVSADRVKEGIGKLDPEAAALADKEVAGKVEADTQRAQDAKTFDKPAGDAVADIPGGDKPAPETVKPSGGVPNDAPKSGTPLTRAQFKAQEDAKKAAALADAGGESAFSKRN